MSLKQIRRAYALFSHPHTEKHIIRHNVKAYLNALSFLGDKHILATPVQRKDH